MKIYTKTGDAGETGLVGGARVSKNTPRLEVCGTYDELNAHLGLVRCELSPVRSEPDLLEKIDRLLNGFQNDLFNAGSELATPPSAAPQCPVLSDAHIGRIEAAIDEFEKSLPPLSNFILPGGCRSAALLHVARTVCRRAERKLVALMQLVPGAINPLQLIYINRLSDLLFVLARTMNHQAGIADIRWRKAEMPDK